MKALVTGGGGFLGRYITKKLMGRDYSVRVLARSPYPDLESIGVEVVQADIRDQNRVMEACKEVDVVFHVAALAAVWAKWADFYGINFEGTKNVVAGCLAHGVRRLVYTSTPAVVFDGSDIRHVDETYPYPEHYTWHYPATKAMAERYIIKANGSEGLLTVALRPHLIWGPGDRHLIPRILQRAKAGKLFIIGDGSNKVDVTYVENAAEAHILVAEHLRSGSPVAGQAYFISQGEPVVVWDFINQILERLGMPRVTKRISRGAATFLGGVQEVVHTILPSTREPFITRFLATHMARSHYFDISKAKRDFGYSPRITTTEGLENLVNSLRSS